MTDTAQSLTEPNRTSRNDGTVDPRAPATSFDRGISEVCRKTEHDERTISLCAAHASAPGGWCWFSDRLTEFMYRTC